MAPTKVKYNWGFMIFEVANGPYIARSELLENDIYIEGLLVGGLPYYNAR